MEKLEPEKNLDHRLIRGFLQGRYPEYGQVTNWIMEVVQSEYWGLQNQWQDILQDVQLKLYINLKHRRFRQASSLRTYVCRIAKYTCIDYLRKKYQHVQVEADFSELSGNSDPFLRLLEKERKEIFLHVYRQLSDVCKEILRMAFIERLKYKEISLQLGIPEGTLKSRISRCIDKAIALRRKLIE